MKCPKCNQDFESITRYEQHLHHEHGEEGFTKEEMEFIKEEKSKS